MPIALLETKLYVPRPRGGLVLRPRLSERLHWGTASKLVLVFRTCWFRQDDAAYRMACGEAGCAGR